MMDLEEVRRILFSRVQGSDAENALKIMGYLLLQDWAEQELAMLALGSDEVLDALVDKAKMELGLHGSCEKKLGSSGSWARAVGSEQLSFGSGQLSFGLVVGQLSFGDGSSAAAPPPLDSSSSSSSSSSMMMMMKMAVAPLDSTSSSSSMMKMSVAPLDLSSSSSMMKMAVPPLDSSSSSSMMKMAVAPLDSSSSSMKTTTATMMMPSPSSSSSSTDEELKLSYFYDAGSNSFGSSNTAAIAMPKLNGSSSSRHIVPYPHPTPQWCTTSTANVSTPSALPHLPSLSNLFHDKNPAFSYNSHLEDHLPHHHGFFRPSPPPPPPPSSNVIAPLSNHSMISIHRSCLFFSRGYCKHGNMCRFLHQIDGPERCSASTGSFNGDLEVESSGSEDGYGSYAHHFGFESFEMELRELLKGRKTPVSIASLPQMYYERFGKSLQADGYLTESQRHGKAGFSLTRLLMKLKGTVRLIERPHGQHAVMLLEESFHLSKDGGRRGPDELVDTMNASSRQIYLTFPAESSFTEEDVTIHFRAYGPVQDVRIPHQQKRMFGFVTFIYPDTVRTILTEGNPHYICGARVLVKPYKEKGRKSSPAAIHRERQGVHLVLQEEKPNIELPKVVEQELRQVEMNGNEQKEATLNPIGTKTDASEFDMADVSLLSSNFKYVLDLLEGENKDAEISDSTLLSVSRINSKALNLKLGSAENISTDTITTTSLQKVRGNPWSSQNTHAGQYGWGPTTLFARDVF